MLNGTNGILRGPGKLIYEKKFKLKISCQTPLKAYGNKIRIIVIQGISCVESKRYWDRIEKGRIPLGQERKGKDPTGTGETRKGFHWDRKEKERIPLGQERKGKDPTGTGETRKGSHWDRKEKEKSH
jgi:hypothetical protein